MRNYEIDGLVDRLTRLDHEHHAPRALQRLNELGDRVRPHYVRALGFVFEKTVDLRHRAVEYRHAIAVVVHVEDKVLAHHGQAYEADITIGVCHGCFRK